jgi:hypothetical protein
MFFVFGRRKRRQRASRGRARRDASSETKNQKAAAAASRSFLVLDGSEIIAKCKRFGLTRDPSNI